VDQIPAPVRPRALHRPANPERRPGPSLRPPAGGAGQL